ncbi:MAG: type II toxin-antitoxin system Phd/YefM family antitoxin [Dehalococcoidia bacterium]
MEVTIHEAKTHLSRLIALVEEGEEIVIKRGKQPAARLVRVEPAEPPERMWGFIEGGWIAEDFNDPLPDSFWGFDEDE